MATLENKTVLTVSSGQTLVVSSGHSVSGAQVLSRGTLEVFGQASATDVQRSGTEIVEAGGRTFGTVLVGSETVSSGGIANGTIVEGRGRQVIFSRGIASGTEVSSGGQLRVHNGGSLFGGTLFRGAGEIVSRGGHAVSMTAAEDCRISVTSHGRGSGLQIDSGGSAIVLSGGTSDSTAGGNYYHFGNDHGDLERTPDTVEDQLTLDLMNGIVFFYNHQYPISKLDLGVLADLGYVTMPSGSAGAALLNQYAASAGNSVTGTLHTAPADMEPPLLTPPHPA